MGKKDFTGWLSKPQVADALGVSDKTIERMVTKGELHQGMMDIAGRRPMPMFDPREVEKLKATMSAPMVLPPSAEGAAVVRAPRSGLVVLQSQTGPEVGKRPMVPIWHRVYLTVREAAAYTGWRVIDLQARIAAGELQVHEFDISEGRKRRLIKRTDLDSL